MTVSILVSENLQDANYLPILKCSNCKKMGDLTYLKLTQRTMQ